MDNAVQMIVEKLKRFRDERDWEQFHNPKDLSIALSIEANELMELFLWKDTQGVDEVDLGKVKEELADVFAFAFLLLDKYGLDLESIVDEKLTLNAQKYPVEKSKGIATKYNKLK